MAILTKYESIFILDDRKFEDSGETFMDKVNSIIQDLGGELLLSEKRGRSQMARPINRRNAATYWDVVMNLPNDQVGVFKDRFRLNNVVLRLEVFKYDRPARISLKAEPVAK